MNAIPRHHARLGQVEQLRATLRGLNLTGIQAATLVDDIHDCIANGAYMDVGSVDLNDIAGRMLKECDVFEVIE